MELSTILMIVGIICIIGSFFLKDTSKKLEQDVEELSLNFYQEANAIKRRLKIIEEELLLEPNLKIKPAPKGQSSNIHQEVKQEPSPKVIQMKPINQILVQQVIELNKQGHPIDEISKMSTLSKEQILHILNNGGQS